MALVPIQTAPQQPIARALLPDPTDAGLAVASLNWKTAQDSLGTDYSANGNDGTVYGKPTSLRVGVSLDGTDDRIDFGDVGNIQQIGMWIKPGSTTEQIVFVDSGTYIHLVAGTVTYVNLTASATYVDGVASTTLVAGRWQYLVCQFTQVDANNLELGWDGTNYGEIDVMDFTAYDSLGTAAMVTLAYRAGVPDDTLLLWVTDGSRDLSRYQDTLTPAGDIVTGRDIEGDGAGDYIQLGTFARFDSPDTVTLAAWVWLTATPTSIWSVAVANYNGSANWDIYFTNNTTIRFHSGAGGGTVDALIDFTTHWHHIVVVATDATNWTLYVDGVNVGSSTRANYFVATGARIGDGNGGQLNGRMRDLRIHSGAKSADWAADLYRKTRGFY